MKLRHAWTLPVTLTALVALSGCVSQKPRTTLPAPAEFSNAERPGSEDYTVRGMEPTWINPFESAKRLIFKTDSVKSGPAAVDGSVAMAQLVEQRGETDKAIAMYRALLARTPHDSLVLHRLGVLYAKKEKFQVSRAFLEKAVKYEPHNPIMLGDLGYAYFRCQRFADAERILRQSLERDPDDATARNNLALVLCVQGHTEKAHAEFKKIGTDAEAHASLGFVLSQSGYQKLARQHFRKAIALDPRLESAIGVLGKEQETVQRENAADEAKAQLAAARQRATTPTSPGEPTNDLTADAAQASPAEPAPDALPEPASAERAYAAPALVRRVRRPPPDPAPVPPAFAPADSPLPAEPTQDEQLAGSSPISTEDDNRFSLSPTKIVPLKTVRSTIRPTTKKPVISKPIMVNDTQTASAAEPELARIEIQPADETKTDQPETAAHAPSGSKPQMVWNNTYQRSTPTKTAPAEPPSTGKIARNETPEAPEPSSLIKLTPRTTSAKVFPTTPTDAKPLPLPSIELANKPMETADEQSEPASIEPLAGPQDIAEVTPDPHQAPGELPPDTATPSAAPHMVQLAPITEPPRGQAAEATNRLTSPEASIVSPEEAAWKPRGRSGTSATTPPPFFHPKGRATPEAIAATENPAAKEKPIAATPIAEADVDRVPEELAPIISPPKHLPPSRAARRAIVPRVVEAEIRNDSRPIEVAEIIAPDNAGWKPASREPVSNSSPPPFFNLTPETAAESDDSGTKEEVSSSSTPRTTVKVTQSAKVKSEAEPKTEPGPQTLAPITLAPTAATPEQDLNPDSKPVPLAPLEVAQPSQMNKKSESPLSTLVTLAPITTAAEDSTPAEAPKKSRPSTPQREPLALAPIVTAKALNAQPLAEEAAAQQQPVGETPSPPVDDDQRLETSEHSSSWLAAYEALVQEAEAVKLPMTPDEKSVAPEKAGDAQLNLAPIVPAKSSKKSESEPQTRQLAPITPASTSGLKRPAARQYQQSLR